jgi:hypothetical protein
MELREAAQEIEMILAPGNDVVEVIAGGDRAPCRINATRESRPAVNAKSAESAR